MKFHGSHYGLPGPLLACLVILAASLGLLVETMPKARAAGIISLEIGKAKALPLANPPDVIMLGNPAVADIVVEGNGRLFLLGREPGETNLLILDEAGEIILSSTIVVGPVNKRRVTVDRRDISSTLSCSPRCTPVATPRGSGATTAGAAPAAPGGQNQPAGGEPRAAGGGPHAAAAGLAAALGGPGGTNIAGGLAGLLGNTQGTR